MWLQKRSVLVLFVPETKRGYRTRVYAHNMVLVSGACDGGDDDGDGETRKS